MTLENAKLLYKHRIELGKPVDDILKRYPELKGTEKVAKKEPLVPSEPHIDVIEPEVKESGSRNSSRRQKR